MMDTHTELATVIAEIKDPKMMADFLEEILTPKELNDLSLRWQLLKSLHQGKPQRAIAAEYKISLCKITRGSRILKKEHSVIADVLQQHYSGGKKQNEETSDL
jgi:TrpR family trp operon transcriptional repressor